MSKEDISAIVGFALATRSTPEINRDLRKASLKETEHYAYLHVLPRISNRAGEQRLLRIAALIASSSVPQKDGEPFGQWARKNGGDNVGVRIRTLVNLPFEQAVSEIQRIVRLVDAQSGFDWFNLASTLYYWGKGVTSESLRVRQAILSDYFRSAQVPATDAVEAEKGFVAEEAESENIEQYQGKRVRGAEVNE